MEKRRFIQIIDFDLPHHTGFVFEIDNNLSEIPELNDRYWVKDICDENGVK